MTILEQAQKLGEAILQTEEYKRFLAAEHKQAEDEAAMKAIEAYNNLRNSFAMEIKDNEPSKERVEEIRKELGEAFEKLDTNPVIHEYIEANKAYTQLIDDIQGIIEMYANGGNTGCAGSCDSCSGHCHH